MLFGSCIIRGAGAERGERVRKIPCVTKYDFQNLVMSSVKATILSNIFAVDLFGAETIKKAQIKSQLFLLYKKKGHILFLLSPCSKPLAVQHLIKPSKRQNKIFPQA